MARLKTMLMALGLGAGMMYFTDPARGKRRRALARDKVMSLRNQSDEAIDVAVRDLRNRTRGVLAEAMAWVSEDQADDWLITERVRSALGSALRYGSVGQVDVQEGKVTLSGSIHPDDMESVVRTAARVRGVKSVDNQLEIINDPAALQQMTERPMRDPEMWTPSARLLSGVGGGLLALYGGMRKGIVGSTLSLAGLGLMARGVANVNLKTLMGMSGERQGIRVLKEIDLPAPVEEVYSFWKRLENLPRFMSHLKEVRDLGNGRSHWVATGPGDTPVEWDAITTRAVENELLSWESVAGSEIKTAGTVRFQRNPDGGTHLVVRMGYTPPAGAIGHAVATLMGVDPKTAMDEDLQRLKGLLGKSGGSGVGSYSVESRSLSDASTD